MALNDDQRQRFDERLRQLGMNPRQVVDVLRTGDLEGPTVLSHRAEESAIPPTWLQVDNIDALKRLAGIPDEDYEDGSIPHHHEDLPPWPQEKNGHRPEDLSAQENEQVRKGLVVFVYGHSARVESYRTVIESHYFPLNAAVFAAEDVTVDAGNPLILKANNGGYNFGTVTIKRGGQIICEGDTHMTCQLMVSEGSGPDMANGANPINNIGGDGKNYTSVPEKQGDFSPPEAQVGNDAVGGDKSCTTEAGTGSDGSQGLNGTTGGAGGNGGNANKVYFEVKQMDGTYSFSTKGGNGGNGGNGGRGGKGQDGGRGGRGALHCNPGRQGKGGCGGTGGNGGAGGNGGNAGQIYIKYSGGSFEVVGANIQAGTAGLPGVGGEGGPGGAGDPPGGTGMGGECGATASNGEAGDIYVNGKVLELT